MRSYHEYKIENHEWVKTIPSHWSFAKIAHFSDLRTGGTPRKNVLAYWENGTIPWMTSGEVNEKNIYKTKSHITESGLNNSNANLLPENSVMIALSGQGKTKATVAILKTIAACSQSLAAFVCNENRLHYRYLFYYLERNYKNIRGLVGDNLRDGLSLTKLREFRSPIPPFPEQCAIANFLDRKTAQIDTLIEKKQHQIELLHEHRTTLINQAVTKDLNPDAPMKDSGIEWLGEVPAHWDFVKVKRVVDVIDGDRSKEYPNINDFVDFGIPFLSSKNIMDNKFDFSKLRFISQEKFERLGRGKLAKGDLVVTVRGTIGSVGYFTGNEYKTAFINAQMMIMRPGDRLSSNFFYYLARSDYWFTQLDYSAYGAAQQQLSNVILQNLSITFPPYEEQIAIEEYLDLRTSQLDKATDRVRTEINQLQEYRIALISAAVTGKIDIREEKVKSTYVGAVLIIGSLLWDNSENRVSWRNSDLNVEHKQYVSAPIRYGRKSGIGRKNTYTMVFSSLCYQEGLGTAVLVPLKEHVSNPKELIAKAANLWHAERPSSQIDSLEISYNWGEVGLLKNPEGSLPDNFVEEWIKHYRETNAKPDIKLAPGETPIITSDGILKMSWPTDKDTGNSVDFDFIFASVNEPKPNDGKYPSVQEIAQACIRNKYTEYFDKNRDNRITTFQDEEIEKFLKDL